jgi:hypothetical protein
MQDGDVRQVIFKMAGASRSDRKRTIPPLCAVGTIVCLFQMYLFLDTSSFRVILDDSPERIYLDLP